MLSHRPWVARGGIALLGASIACGSTTSPAPGSPSASATTVESTAPGASAAPLDSAGPDGIAPRATPIGDPSTLTIDLVSLPAAPAFDGKLVEWGPRLPDAEGPSWIRVALRESGAVVAAELRGDALEGARFKIRFPAPNEPAGDAPETPFCKVKTESTAPFQPTLTPIADGCMVTQSLCRYPASGFTERFEREFVIDQSGVRSVAHDGSSSPLPEVRVLRESAVLRAEGPIPPTALPLVSTEPLARVALAAAPSARSEALDATAWRWRDTSITFGGPDAAARSQLARFADTGVVSAAFQPGTEQLFMLGCADGGGLLLQRRVGFVALAKMGDVEVGSFFDPTLGVATRKSGAIVHTIALGLTEQPRTAVRGGRMWVAGMHDGARTQIRVPQYNPRFTVLVIDGDGHIRQIGLEQYHVNHWYKASPSFAADLSTLTLTGEADAARSSGPDVVTWRYDAASDSYKITQHTRGEVEPVDPSTLGTGVR